MSTKGRKYESISERNRCLWQSYKIVIEQAPGPVKTSEIYGQVVNMPCPQFWISSEQAAKIISALERRCIDLNSLSVTRREMMSEIIKRIGQLKEKSPLMTMRECIEDVVYSPAPRFYLTPKSAKTILHHYRRQLRSKPRP